MLFKHSLSDICYLLKLDSVLRLERGLKLGNLLLRLSKENHVMPQKPNRLEIARISHTCTTRYEYYDTVFMDMNFV